MLIWNFPCNCVHCSISSFVLSNQHFVIHFKFNIVPCINQNWGWHKNCRNMFLKVIFLNQLSLLTVRRFSQIGRQKNWSLKMGLSWKSLLICQYYGESSWNSLWTASKNPPYIFLKMRKVRAQKKQSASDRSQAISCNLIKQEKLRRTKKVWNRYLKS